MVSICTVTYNRPLAVKLLEKRILEQTYPTECMEWVLIDDSPSDIPDFEPAPGSNLKINYVRLPNKLTLGRKRNLSNNHCKGDIIVYMDDDDYYPPTGDFQERCHSWAAVQATYIKSSGPGSLSASVG